MEQRFWKKVVEKIVMLFITVNFKEDSRYVESILKSLKELHKIPGALERLDLLIMKTAEKETELRNIYYSFGDEGIYPLTEDVSKKLIIRGNELERELGIRK